MRKNGDLCRHVSARRQSCGINVFTRVITVAIAKRATWQKRNFFCVNADTRARDTHLPMLKVKAFIHISRTSHRKSRKAKIRFCLWEIRIREIEENAIFSICALYMHFHPYDWKIFYDSSWNTKCMTWLDIKKRPLITEIINPRRKMKLWRVL